VVLGLLVQSEHEFKMIEWWISGVFRKGGDVIYLADALIEIHDPKEGAHSKKGVGFVQSDVAEIGLILKKHLEFLDNTNKVKAVQ